jgi:hypothetical protein
VKFREAPRRDHDFGGIAASSVSPSSPQPAPLALPGERSRTSGAGGPQRPGSFPGSRAWAARGRSTPSAPATPSRAAVTAVTSHGGASPQGAASPCGLTADPAHNPPRSAGRAAPLPARPPLSSRSRPSRPSPRSRQPRPADPPALFAVDAPSLAAASRRTDPVTSWSGRGDALLSRPRTAEIGTRGLPTTQLRLVNTKHLRPAPLASAGTTSREVPAAAA